MTGAIPTIDLDDLDTPDGSARVGRDLDRAYGALGFAYVVNHGVPQEAIDGVFDASAQFHALPPAAKQAIAVNRFHRGYLGFATATDRASSIEAAAHPNFSESFIKLHEPASGGRGPLDGPNQWPDGLAGFKEAVLAYEAHLERLARGLVRAVAEALAGDASALDPAFTRPTTWLRLLHYPARPADAPPGLYGSAPHTDFGVELAPVRRHNPGTLLAAMLQRIEPQIGEIRRLRMPVDSNDSTLVVKLIVVHGPISPHRQNSYRFHAQQ